MWLLYSPSIHSITDSSSTTQTSDIETSPARVFTSNGLGVFLVKTLCCHVEAYSLRLGSRFTVRNTETTEEENATVNSEVSAASARIRAHCLIALVALLHE